MKSKVLQASGNIFKQKKIVMERPNQAPKRIEESKVQIKPRISKPPDQQDFSSSKSNETESFRVDLRKQHSEEGAEDNLVMKGAVRSYRRD